MKQIPLDNHQQDLINLLKSAHNALSIARKLKPIELSRRIDATRNGAEAAAREAIDIAKGAYDAKVALIRMAREKAIDESTEGIRQELTAEIVAHESNLDSALIEAYNDAIPIRRIALDGFGNRYDGGVQQLLVKLRADGRIGNREKYQRNTEGSRAEVAFPKPFDMDATLAEGNNIGEPTFTLLPVELVLVQPDENGQNGMTVPAVRLDMDERDPWFKRIEANARPGTPYKRATYCTLYEHPATEAIVAHESREEGQTFWDHPVARWAQMHYDAAQAGFYDAVSAAAAESSE